MTDIALYNQQFQVEDLSWDLTKPEMGASRGGTLSVAAFSSSQHYANGYLPSGTVLGVITASGLLGPYLDSASDGRQTAVGILKATVTLVQANGTAKTKVGCAYRVAFCDISTSKLPFTSSNAALGGYLDAAAQADLKLIYFGA